MHAGHVPAIVCVCVFELCDARPKFRSALSCRNLGSNCLPHTLCAAQIHAQTHSQFRTEMPSWTANSTTSNRRRSHIVHIHRMLARLKYLSTIDMKATLVESVDWFVCLWVHVCSPSNSLPSFGAGISVRMSHLHTHTHTPVTATCTSYLTYVRRSLFAFPMQHNRRSCCKMRVLPGSWVQNAWGYPFHSFRYVYFFFACLASCLILSPRLRHFVSLTGCWAIVYAPLLLAIFWCHSFHTV